MAEATKIDDGGAAFACPAHEGEGCIHHNQEGMSLRDYFAARMMPLVAESAIGGTTNRDVSITTFTKPEQWLTEGRVAYAMADALLAARSYGR